MTRSSIFWSVILGSWALAIAGAFAWWMFETSLPGKVDPTPVHWPESSRVTRADSGLTLVLFIHPHCPCSQATLGELARIMARGNGRLRADVLLYRPSENNTDWQFPQLWSRLTAMPGVRVHWDEDGHEARLFGAKTSGHVVVYDEQGTLRFSGGITPSRGQEGDNVGRDSILTLVLTGTTHEPTMAVFGCPLADLPARSGD